MTSDRIDKEGFPHFMLKEIHDQVEVVQACLDAFFNKGEINLGFSTQIYAGVEQIQIIGCGSSRHASLIGKYLFEQLAGIPTRVHCAPEFIDAPPPKTPNTLIIGVTQSGETADTLAALKIEKERDSKILGITNKSGSSLEKLVDYTIHTPAGIEKAIAATKTFLAQLIVFYFLAIDLAYYRQNISNERKNEIIASLSQISAQIYTILQSQKQAIEKLAENLLDKQNFILLGRGINFPIALEGALKLKETNYIHAEGYQAGEFMHGPIAMLDDNVAVLAIAMPGVVYEKLITNLQRVKKSGVSAIAISSTDKTNALEIFSNVVRVGDVDELLSPILSVIPIQLLAYYLAVGRGLDVDNPRNLTKAIT